LFHSRCRLCGNIVPGQETLVIDTSFDFTRLGDSRKSKELKLMVLARNHAVQAGHKIIWNFVNKENVFSKNMKAGYTKNIPSVDVTLAYVLPNFNYNFDEFLMQVKVFDEKSIGFYLHGRINQIIGAMKFGTWIKLAVDNYKKQMTKIDIKLDGYKPECKKELEENDKKTLFSQVNHELTFILECMMSTVDKNIHEIQNISKNEIWNLIQDVLITNIQTKSLVFDKESFLLK
jgi:hypothetical protein